MEVICSLTGDMVRQYMTEKTQADFIQKEDEALFCFLQTCEKSALLLPEYLCHKYRRLLGRKGYIHVFIGKEEYTNITVGYSVHGHITNVLLRRLNGIKTGGLFDWWNQFVQSQYNFGASEITSTKEPVKPAMKGNVLLIFLLLVCGLMIAFAGFIMERKATLIRTIRKWRFLFGNCCVVVSELNHYANTNSQITKSDAVGVVVIKIATKKKKV